MLRNSRHVVTWTSLPFVLAHIAIAHKEARFLFPLAILATAFPVLGFSPRLPLWRETFARLWQWRRSWPAKITTAISVAGRGELDLAVPTPPGVHEPRNRRVQITVR